MGVEKATLVRRLLACGAVAGPLFLIIVLIQDYTRSSVEPRRQPLSLLTLGDLGWIQITNFVLAGLLNVAFAIGLRMALRHGPGRLWGPLLIGTYGIGLILAGVFVPDPAFGFPPGAAEGMPSETSWHANLHTVAALVVFSSLIAATFVFARRFFALKQWPWTVYCVLGGAAVLGFVLLSSNENMTSVSLRAAAAVGWGWASLLAVRVKAEYES